MARLPPSLPAERMTDDGIVVAIAPARQQPKLTEEERKLQENYGKIVDLEEWAFSILVDLIPAAY
jgi:hypothetical protein